MQANKVFYWKVDVSIDPGTATDENGKTVREQRPYIPSFITRATVQDMQAELRKRIVLLKMKYGGKGELDELDNTSDEINPSLYARYDTELTDDLEFTAAVTLIATIQPFEETPASPQSDLSVAYKFTADTAAKMDESEITLLILADIWAVGRQLHEGEISAAEVPEALKAAPGLRLSEAESELDSILDTYWDGVIGSEDRHHA